MSPTASTRCSRSSTTFIARSASGSRRPPGSCGCATKSSSGRTKAYRGCEETQLELALLTRVTKALDAMPSGGTLTLAAASDGGRLRIAVRDTGGGIDAAVLPRIFEPWVTTKAAGRGTGLGLTITRDLVTSLGGTIAVSTSHGRGTTFTIELPPAASAVEGS